MKQLRDLDILDLYISLRQEIDNLKQENAQLKQSQKQLAIDELEKVIDYIRTRAEILEYSKHHRQSN